MTVRVVRMAVLVCLLSVAVLRAVADTPVAVEERLRRDITYLASNECEGRGVSTQGINLAADYLVAEFTKAGLKPPAANPGYFQPFTMAGDTKAGSGHRFVLRGPLGQVIELKQETHFQPVGLSNKGQVTAPLLFVGYGVSADSQNYDDYRGLDVAGKVVVMLRKTPRADNPHLPFDGQQRDFHAGLETKVVKADLKKAAAILFVNDADTARNGDALMPFTYTAQSGSPAKVPVLHIRRSVLDGLVQSSLGCSLRDLEQDINRTAQPRSSLLSGWTADLTVNVKRQVLHVKNVVGVVPGAGKLADETVVVGAHYDHLGYGDRRFSLFRTDKPAIHHGADDNGSGTTALLELARRYGRLSDQGDRRRLVFIAFTAEELGLIGSAHYCKNPLFPLEKTVAMVNLDMVGRLRPDPKTNRDRVYVEGSGTAKQFGALLDQLAQKHDVEMSRTASGNGPSDHASFYSAKIPVVFYWTGNHPDYHKPSDTADKINLAGMRKIVALANDTITHLATTPERPEYVYIAPPQRSMGMRSGPRLGIVPNYADENEGVLLDGVSEGGPAAKAGMLAGDRLISLAGQPVRNVNTYMVLMAGKKKGETIEVTVLRKSAKVNLKVVLE